MKQIITSDMYVEDIAEKYPSAVRILTELGVICIQCGAPVWGTLEESIERTGLDVKQVIAKLNQAMEQTTDG
ncbi:MAG: hypothetical protein P9M15_02205 [Candidatus Electryoneaceae bacterium]|nr:hypothetical protein [Candidatus Electryoneaceae bacterium]